MTNEEMIQWIDAASYENLLYMWRFEPEGSPFFSLEMGKHFALVMAVKRSEIGDAEAVRISKKIGWEE